MPAGRRLGAAVWGISSERVRSACVLNDLRSRAMPRPAVALLAVGTLGFVLVTALDSIRPLIEWDHAASAWLQGPEVGALVLVGGVTEYLFSPVLSSLIALAGIALLWRSGRRQLALSLALFFVAVAAAAALKFVLRHPSPGNLLVVRRVFPSTALPAELNANGFPSGHETRAAFLIGWFSLRSASTATLGLLLALVVGWTRIYVGDHFLFDVLGGLFLAAVFLAPA